MSLIKRWMEDQGLFETDEFRLEDDYEFDNWIASQYLNSSSEDYLIFPENMGPF